MLQQESLSHQLKSAVPRLLSQALQRLAFSHQMQLGRFDFLIVAICQHPRPGHHGFLKIREGTAKLAKSAKKKQET